ncbi:hypothetical protein FB45DRAFT_948144 [Roridomyces roridus]|uniref:Uncharacterized protein n=1 Tax=Roridomyces roridus TaxID=1738132 RepID=A0AAD7B0T0_9AGAR|nr:hypothetical protein FB45DRAFT_948144 [Roridomyces roridus]
MSHMSRITRSRLRSHHTALFLSSTSMAPVGTPKESPKPQPMGGNIPVIFLVTTGTIVLLFVLWRRAAALRSVISHQLKTITRTEGAIRLSEDDGPPAREFLEDDYDEDHTGLELEIDASLADRLRDREVAAPSEPQISSRPTPQDVL